jgi:hypothetical protein
MIPARFIVPQTFYAIIILCFLILQIKNEKKPTCGQGVDIR